MRREPALRHAAVPALMLGVVLVCLWRLTLNPLGVAYPPGSDYTDLLLTHLPNADYTLRVLWEFGQWPLWNAQIFGGQPFAADPLAGLWYPPMWVLLVPGLPLTLGFNLLLALHLAWGGWGLYHLLRAEGVSLGPALLGGIAFAAAPKLVAHLGAGHVSLVFAVAWTPWLLAAMRAAIGRGGLYRGAMAGACLAILVLADVRWAFYAALLAAAYGAWLWATTAGRIDLAPATARARFAALSGFGPITVLLSAVLVVPLLEFIGQSSRVALTLAEAAVYSLPPVSLLGVLLRDTGGFHEHMTYAGTVTLLLAVLSLGRRTLFWSLAILAAAAFALGDNFVLFPRLFGLLPGLSLLRVPPRAWFVAALGLCMLAGHGAQRLTQTLWPMFVARYARVRVRLPQPRIALLVIGLVSVLDLARFDSTLFDVRARPPLAAAAAWLRAQPGHFRVYSPSHSLMAGDGLEHVDGVNPLQLAAAVAFLEAATGVGAGGYSVTIPAFNDGTPDVANRDALPVAPMLGWLNVRYVASEFPLAASELEAVEKFGDTYLYENTAWQPRAWLADGNAVDSMVWSPNRIEIVATGPGRLVLSEVAYPGWHVRVSGVPAALETEFGLLRAVDLPAGPQTVVFTFRPLSVYAGLALTLLGVLGLGWLHWHQRPA